MGVEEILLEQAKDQGVKIGMEKGEEKGQKKGNYSTDDKHYHQFEHNDTRYSKIQVSWSIQGG